MVRIICICHHQKRRSRRIQRGADIYQHFVIQSFHCSSPQHCLPSHRHVLLVDHLSSLYFIQHRASSTRFHHRLVLYFLSISLGFGAASILISQTLFVNRSANIYERQKGLPINSKLGYFNGIFLMFFFVNKLTGYLISAVLFAYGLHEDIVFAVLSTLCLCGSLGLLMISDTDSPGIDAEDPESERLMDERAKSETISLSLSGSVASVADVKTNVSKMISMWKSTKFLSLVGFTIFTGVDMEFVSGEFPLFFSDKSTKFFVLALSGLSASASSFVLGKLSDSKLSRIQILKAGFVCKLMVYLYLYWNIKPLWMLYTSDSDQIVHENPDIQRECELVVYGLVLCAALMGIGDGCLLVQEPAMYVLMLGNHPEVFASMRVWKGLAAAACYFLHSFFTLPEKVLINLALVVLSFLPLNYCAVRQRLN